MPLTLSHHPASRHNPELEVVMPHEGDDTDDLYRMRFEIYVEQYGLVPPDHEYVQDGKLIDPFDTRSINLILMADGEVSGSIRFTERRHGPLEVEAYKDISTAVPDVWKTAEVGRFMVRKSLNGTLAAPLLMHGLWQVMSRSRSRYVLVSGKAGYQARLYQNQFAAGLTVFPETYKHGLTDTDYVLMMADLGELVSLRRAVWHAHALFLTGTVLHTPFGMSFLKRGTRRR